MKYNYNCSKMAYHDNLYWRECEAIKTLDLPKDIQNNIMMYFDGTSEYKTLTNADVIEIMRLINEYECVIRFNGDDCRISYTRLYVDDVFLIRFISKNIHYEFVSYLPNYNQTKLFDMDQWYWQKIVGLRYEGGSFSSTWEKCDDVDNTLRLRFGKKRIGLWQRIKNIFKK